MRRGQSHYCSHYWQTHIRAILADVAHRCGIETRWDHLQYGVECFQTEIHLCGGGYGVTAIDYTLCTLTRRNGGLQKVPDRHPSQVLSLQLVHI